MRKAFFKRLCSLTLALALVCSLAPAALASTDAKGHWDSEFATLADAHKVADLLNIQMMCEGMVLLKNGKPGQPVLPLDPAKDGITMLGAASYNVVSGGMGSGAGGGIDVTMQQSLRDAGFKVNPLMERTYADLPQSMYMGAVSAGVRAYKWSVVQEDPACVKSAEYSLKNYRNVIWTLSRVGCEGSDGFTSNVPNNADPSKHFLQLSDNEEKMLAYLTELKEAGKIDSVTVMIGSANVMEMGPLQDSDAIDCIFWLGQPGPNGLAAVGKLLSGEANPSGKTVDIWNANHKADPTWFNFGDNTQHDSWAFNEETQKWEKLDDEAHPRFNNNAYADGKADPRTNTLEYEEDVYLGYKWYETACAEDALRQLPTYDAAYASEADPNGYYNRGNGVVYPFGYGLSYTTFAQEFVTTADELAAAINEQAALAQDDADLAAHELLGVSVVRIDGQTVLAVPQSAVHQRRPLDVQLGLLLQRLGVKAQGLKRLVRLDEQQRGGALVALAALDAHDAVLDHVDATKAVAASNLICLDDGIKQRHLLTVDGRGDALLKTNDDGLGLVGAVLPVLGHRPDVCGRRVPGVLQHAALDGTAPQVVVDGVGLLLGGGHGHAVGLRPLHLLVTRLEIPLAHRGDELERGIEGLDGGLEAHLVVALAGAAVGDVLRAVLVGEVDEPLRDQRAGQGGEQRVDALVLAVGPDCLREDLLGVLLAHVDCLGDDGAHVVGLLLDGAEVALVLADVAADGDDVHVLLNLEPLDDDGRVQTAGVREDDLFLLCHDVLFLSICCTHADDNRV